MHVLAERADTTEALIEQLRESAGAAQGANMARAALPARKRSMTSSGAGSAAAAPPAEFAVAINDGILDRIDQDADRLKFVEKQSREMERQLRKLQLTVDEHSVSKAAVDDQNELVMRLETSVTRITRHDEELLALATKQADAMSKHASLETNVLDILGRVATVEAANTKSGSERSQMGRLVTAISDAQHGLEQRLGKLDETVQKEHKKLYSATNELALVREMTKEKLQHLTMRITTLQDGSGAANPQTGQREDLERMHKQLLKHEGEIGELYSCKADVQAVEVELKAKVDKAELGAKADLIYCEHLIESMAKAVDAQLRQVDPAEMHQSLLSALEEVKATMRKKADRRDIERLRSSLVSEQLSKAAAAQKGLEGSCDGSLASVSKFHCMSCNQLTEPRTRPLPEVPNTYIKAHEPRSATPQAMAAYVRATTPAEMARRPITSQSSYPPQPMSPSQSSDNMPKREPPLSKIRSDVRPLHSALVREHEAADVVAVDICGVDGHVYKGSLPSADLGETLAVRNATPAASARPEPKPSATAAGMATVGSPWKDTHKEEALLLQPVRATAVPASKMRKVELGMDPPRFPAISGSRVSIMLPHAN